MVLGFASEVLGDSPSAFLVLVFTFGLMLTVTRFWRKLRKEIPITISLAVICFVVSVVPDLFSKYILDLAHVSSHVMFSATVLLCALILQYTMTETFTSLSTSLYKRLEIDIFDRLQYDLAETFTSLINGFRRSHTGILSFNMLALPLLFLFSLIFLYL